MCPARNGVPSIASARLALRVVASGSAAWRMRCVARLGNHVPGASKPPIMPWATSDSRRAATRSLAASAASRSGACTTMR